MVATFGQAQLFADTGHWLRKIPHGYVRFFFREVRQNFFFLVTANRTTGK
jgi:hypothetical protein